jgi:hypothetical protein
VPAPLSIRVGIHSLPPRTLLRIDAGFAANPPAQKIESRRPCETDSQGVERIFERSEGRDAPVVDGPDVPSQDRRAVEVRQPSGLPTPAVSTDRILPPAARVL